MLGTIARLARARTWSISAVADVGSPAAATSVKKEVFAASLRLRSTLSSVPCAPLDDVATKAFVPCCCSSKASDPSTTVFMPRTDEEMKT